MSQQVWKYTSDLPKSLKANVRAQHAWTSRICFPPSVGARISTLLLAPDHRVNINNRVPTLGGKHYFDFKRRCPWPMDMITFASCLTNIVVFMPRQCGLTYRPWGVRSVFLETCEKHRIRNCAAKPLWKLKVLHLLGCSRRLGSISPCPSSPWFAMAVGCSRRLGSVSPRPSSLWLFSTFRKHRAARSTKSNRFRILSIKKF